LLYDDLDSTPLGLLIIRYKAPPVVTGGYSLFNPSGLIGSEWFIPGYIGDQSDAFTPSSDDWCSSGEYIKIAHLYHEFTFVQATGQSWHERIKNSRGDFESPRE